MTVWSSFYDHIMPELNGVTTALVDFHLRQISIDFCEKTSIHTAEVVPINVVAGTASYTLTSPVAETEPHRVKAAWHNGYTLAYAAIDALDTKTYWPTLTGTQIIGFTQRQPDTLIVYPQPDTSGTGDLRVELILRPTQTATGLTDWIATRYKSALAAGVKAALMAMPDKPWSRPDFAMVNLSRYQQARAQATVDANRSLTRAALSVMMRPAA